MTSPQPTVPDEREATHSLLHPFREYRPLAGFSGSAVYAVNRGDGKWFVRKFARRPEESERLRLQALQQVEFESSGPEWIRTPSVLDTGTMDDCFWYDMRFVHGEDAESFLIRANYDQVAAFTDLLTRLVEWSCGQQEPCDEAGRPFRSTAGTSDDRTFSASLKERLLPLATGPTADVAAEAIERIECVAMLLDAEGPTWCHGDLTLENIIVDPHGGVWLIDFLDPPFNHAWLDAAKLNQSLVAGWPVVREHRISPATALFIRDAVRTQVNAALPGFDQVEGILLATTLLRTVPYLESADLVQVILDRAGYFITAGGDIRPEGR